MHQRQRLEDIKANRLEQWRDYPSIFHDQPETVISGGRKIRRRAVAAPPQVDITIKNPARLSLRAEPEQILFKTQLLELDLQRGLQWPFVRRHLHVTIKCTAQVVKF